MSPASEARFAKVSEVMSRRATGNLWHVIPHKRRWIVLRERAHRATRILESRSDAVALARSLAQEAGGEVVIHRKDGTMQERQVVNEADGRLETVYTYSGSPELV